MKIKRQEKIIELIEKYNIDTQEELLRRLRGAGFDVTQATVSRDIKELRLIKTLSGDGRYRYATSAEELSSDMSFKFLSIFSESVKTVDYAGNIVVVKCYTGMANAACAALDSIHWNGVVGTLAGDDTIFVLIRSEHRALELVGELKKLMNKKEKDPAMRQ